MKLNITLGGQSKGGYFNIDPTANDNDAEKSNIPLNQLDKVVEDAECTEIIIENLLNYLPLQQIGPVVNGIVKKMRRNSKLIVIFTNVNLVTKLFYNNTISESTYNGLIFGAGNITKQCVFSIDYIRGILEGNTLTIESIKNSGPETNIIAGRK